MASNTPSRPVKLPASSQLQQAWSDRLVDRQLLEEAITLWEQALALPPAEAPARDERRLRLGAPLTAPKVAGADNVQPTSIQMTDGMVPINREQVLGELDQYVESRIQLPVETVLTFEVTSQPAERVFIFEEPVVAESQAHGRLYTRDGYGKLVALPEGVPARLIIEHVSDGQLGGEVRKDLVATVRDAVALWRVDG